MCVRVGSRFSHAFVQCTDALRPGALQLRGTGHGAVDALDLSRKGLGAASGSFVARLIRFNRRATYLDLSYNRGLSIAVDDGTTLPTADARVGKEGASCTGAWPFVREAFASNTTLKCVSPAQGFPFAHACA